MIGYSLLVIDNDLLATGISFLKIRSYCIYELFIDTIIDYF